jgi:hypothetical protein
MTAFKRGISLQLLVTAAIILSMLVLAASLLFQATVARKAPWWPPPGGRRAARRHRQRAYPPSARPRRRRPAPAQLRQHLADRQPAGAPGAPAHAVENLRANPTPGAVYIGYPNGEFAGAGLARSGGAGTAQRAEKIVYLVQSLTLDPQGALLGEWRFYDRDLRLLQRQERPDYRSTRASGPGTSRPTPATRR